MIHCLGPSAACSRSPSSKPLGTGKQMWVASKPEDLSKPEAWDPKRLLVKCQGVGAASASSKLGYKSIRECSSSLLERYHGSEDLLLVLHHQDIDLEHTLDSGSDFCVA